MESVSNLTDSVTRQQTCNDVITTVVIQVTQVKLTLPSFVNHTWLASNVNAHISCLDPNKPTGNRKTETPNFCLFLKTSSVALMIYWDRRKLDVSICCGFIYIYITNYEVVILSKIYERNRLCKNVIMIDTS